ncbi:MAG: hypothetical protein ACK4PI_03200 [Tepidisphaerales bacterium]
MLPGGGALLCRDVVGGRQLVLKPLPALCLRPSSPSTRDGPTLHPHVRARLQRVRELADPRVGGLCGVEEDATLGPMVLWTYVPGKDLSRVSRHELPGGGVLKLAWAVVDAVDGLHLLGLVHGRLHLRNVIVVETRRPSDPDVVLTHPSPLFVDDPLLDALALHTLLSELNARHRPWDEVSARQHALLALALSDAASRQSVTHLRARLLHAIGDAAERGRGASGPAGAPPSPGVDRATISASSDVEAERRRSWRLAVLALLLGAAVSLYLSGGVNVLVEQGRQVARWLGAAPPGPAPDADGSFTRAPQGVGNGAAGGGRPATERGRP